MYSRYVQSKTVKMENNKEGDNILRPDFSKSSFLEKEDSVVGEQEEIPEEITVITSEGPKTFRIDNYHKEYKKPGKVINFPKKQLAGVK